MNALFFCLLFNRVHRLTCCVDWVSSECPLSSPVGRFHKLHVEWVGFPVNVLLHLLSDVSMHRLHVEWVGFTVNALLHLLSDVVHSAQILERVAWASKQIHLSFVFSNISENRAWPVDSVQWGLSFLSSRIFPRIRSCRPWFG